MARPVVDVAESFAFAARAVASVASALATARDLARE